MSQKLPVSSFDWVKDTSQFIGDFIKKHSEESDEGYFLELDVRYLKKLHELHNDLLFFPERMKIEKPKSFQLIYMIKLNTLYA